MNVSYSPAAAICQNFEFESKIFNFLTFGLQRAVAVASGRWCDREMPPLFLLEAESKPRPPPEELSTRVRILGFSKL